uniref:Uncharacterized protein n=1 Tax=Oryza barthii TaxID=65489 RepID=A0A0D3GXN3_9ORYZ
MGLGNGLTSDEPALNGEGDGRLKLKLAAPVVSSKFQMPLVATIENLIPLAELGKKSSGPLSPVLPTTGLIISAYLLWTYEFIWWCDLFCSQTGCYKSECRRWLLNQGRYPDSDLRTAKDGQCMKVTGINLAWDSGQWRYIKEGSRVCIMGVVQRNDNVLMIVHPSEPISTGCQSASG